MAVNEVTNGNAAVILRAEPSKYVPELLGTGSTHAGPFIQIEGHGGDVVVTSLTSSGSATDFSGKTIYQGMPVEGQFSDIILTSGTLLAYRKRA